MSPDRRLQSLSDSEAVLRQLALELDDLGPTYVWRAASPMRENSEDGWRNDATGSVRLTP
jgi:hypothetical protein